VTRPCTVYSERVLADLARVTLHQASVDSGGDQKAGTLVSRAQEAQAQARASGSGPSPTAERAWTSSSEHGTRTPHTPDHCTS
jgi:hypothetical protein